MTLHLLSKNRSRINMTLSMLILFLQISIYKQILIPALYIKTVLGMKWAFMKMNNWQITIFLITVWMNQNSFSLEKAYLSLLQTRLIFLICQGLFVILFIKLKMMFYLQFIIWYFLLKIVFLILFSPIH